MPLILARVDDRLIHGQVTEGWCPKLTPVIILVVSEDVAASDWHRELCLASLPPSITGLVTNVAEAPAAINKLQDDARFSYVLFESPADAYKAVKNGALLTEINIGGMHSTSGKREILDHIFVDDEDVKYIKGLRELGIKLDFRDLPDSEKTDVLSRL
ncbi:MAG: PTS sugar transporter subunit IIB [Candidatus Latescibacteria bacterium]|nr:PTS sugar transporter subunit IIB [Candidatus Latescibacterota bacterium]